jgi:hypothetical protein
LRRLATDTDSQAESLLDFFRQHPAKLTAADRQSVLDNLPDICASHEHTGTVLTSIREALEAAS